MARLLRAVVVLAPLIASFLFALWLSHALPIPESLAARVVRWLGIAGASTVLLVALQRGARRLLPLPALLSLTLVFPDEAPSRFRLALRSYSARDLQREVRAAGGAGAPAPARESGVTAQQAAERLLVLVAALSRHDRMTRGHSERVRAYALMIGEELGLATDELDRLRWAGLLHDVGKLRVPPEILNKPGRLTDAEFAVIREHTTHGAALVAGLAEWLGDEVRAVDQHHERWAGGGYPYGLRGEQIVRAARIVAVADAFDVMTSARSYKRPMPAPSARAELQRCAGSQFDPSAVRAMLSISLGRLWRVMGPLSWLAQLRLFPRQAAQGGTAAATTAAAAVAAAVTAIAGLIAGGETRAAVRPAAVAVAAPIEPATAPPASDPAVGPTTTTMPATVVARSAPATSLIVPVTAPSTTGARPLLSPATTTVPRPAPTTSTLPPPGTTTTLPSVPAGTTTVAPTTTVATTAAATTTTITTTTSAAITTTTTTTPPPAAEVLGLASSGPGDSPAQPLLDLVIGATTRHAVLPNYDTDRNADPGLTLIRSPAVLETTDPAARQVWRLPADVRTIPAAGSLTLWIAPAGAAAAGDALMVRAGLFDCDAAGSDCVRLARDTAVLSEPGPEFAALVFDLSPGSPIELAAGRRAELRVAVHWSSDLDAWLAYDAAGHPSSLVLGP